MSGIAHLSDSHHKDWLLHGCTDIVFTTVHDTMVHPDGTVQVPDRQPGVYVDCEPDTIMISDELVDALRHAVNEASHVRDNRLRIIVVNADLTYELERLRCGCWLGRKL